LSKKTIYLVGPIDGLNNSDAMNWRVNAKKAVCDKYNVYIPSYQDSNETPNEIWDRDYFYVDNSDILIVNLDYDNNKPFLDTSIEISRAFYQNKIIIVFSSKDWVHNSKTIKYHATKIVKNLEEAIEYVVDNHF